MELIDRDKTLNILRSTYRMDALDRIEKLPTIDAIPRERIADMVEELTRNIKCFYFSDDEPTRYFQAEEVMKVIYTYLYKEQTDENDRR